MTKAPAVELGERVSYTDSRGIAKVALVCATPESAGDRHPLSEGEADLFVISRPSGGYVRNGVPFTAEPTDGTRSWRQL